jgi:hypothetical protein
MAGLYDGLEEAAFKQVSNGYVFTSNCPWLIGPRRRYLVNESQKAEIAECIRQTLRRVKPFVFSAAILIPLVLIGSIFWSRRAARPERHRRRCKRQTTTRQWIGPRGATGTLAGCGLAHLHQSGASSSEATVTVQGYRERRPVLGGGPILRGGNRINGRRERPHHQERNAGSWPAQPRGRRAV